MELFAKLGIDWRLLIWQVINFIILFAVLTKLLYQPVLKILDERSRKIAQGLKDAETATLTKQKSEEERSHVVREARKEAQKIIEAARSEGEKAKAEILETAKRETDKVLLQAKQNIEAAKREMVQEVMAGKERMFPDALLVERLKENKKLKIIKENQTLTPKLMQDFNMGRGEASTVAIVIKEKESIVFTDNRQGRKAATIHDLLLVGSVEMVVHLYQKKKISPDKAARALKILEEADWFEPYLIEKAKEEIS